MTRPAVSIGIALAFLLTFAIAHHNAPIPPEVAVWSAALGGGLAWLTIVDLRSLRLPDTGTLTLTVIGLMATYRLNPPVLPWHALAALGAFAFIALANALYHRVRGMDGIGGGDAKLLMAAGAWTGPAGVAAVLFISTLTALAVFAAAAALGWRIGRETRLPFGPFLCFALWMTWLFGPVV